MKTQLESARELIALGFSVVPIEHRQKGLRLLGWETLRLSAEDLPKYFKHGSPGNVGILLGLNGITDVDLDCDEANQIADEYLPQTSCVFGKSSTPRAHRVYRIDPGIPSIRIIDPVKRGTSNKNTILELRCLKADKTVGFQTVAAGFHTSDEPIGFFNGCSGLPSETTAEVLTDAVNKIGAVVLLHRNAPDAGRNPYFMAVAGILARSGWAFGESHRLMRSLWGLIWPNAVDEHACEAELRATYRKFEAGGEVTGIPTLREFITHRKTLSIILDLLNIGADEKEDKSERTRRVGRREQETNELEHLLSGVQFFNDGKDGFARVEVNGHHECWIVTSDRFKQILLGRYYAAHRALPGKEAMQDVINLCAFRAMQGPVQQVFSRIGHVGNADGERSVYIDLANENWQAVEITANGWRVVNEPPVYFRRPGGMLPLPTPETGGSLDELRPLINASNDATWILICSWLAAVFQPEGAQPILLLLGGQGSAKSTTATLLRKLTDPNVVPLSGPPESARDFAITCVNCGVVAFDNLSGVRPWLSDAMCRVASGAGFRTRSLYKDAEEQVMLLRKPLLLNGIDSVERNDLIDRCLGLTLERITEATRRTEREIYEAFDKAHSRILGALLSVVSAGLKNLATTKLPSAPRMVDFAHWIVACEGALPWEAGKFLRVYSENRKEASQDSVEDDPFALAVAGFAQAFRGGTSWCGTAQRLLEALSTGDDYRTRGDRWPRDAAAVGRWLRRAEPALRALGVVVVTRREGKTGTRKIFISYQPNEPGISGDERRALLPEMFADLSKAA